MIKLSMLDMKKLLAFLFLFFISGCSITGLIADNEGKKMYVFTWAAILILFVISLIILWLMRYIIKNAK